MNRYQMGSIEPYLKLSNSSNYLFLSPNVVSRYGSIVSSNGDVDVAANYTGASLLVESKGNIRFGGDINITLPDTSGLPAGPDTATLSTSSGLILRSGQSALTYGGVNSGVVPNAGNGFVPAGITLGGNVTLQPFNEAGGIVNLTAAWGNVSTRGMATNGGAINVNSAGSITTNGQTLSTKNGDDFEAYFNSYDPNSDSYTYRGSGLPTLQGGAISLLAANGNITTGNLDSYSFSVLKTASGGGKIHLEASNGSINTGNLNSFSYSNSESGNTGQGGAIRLTAANDIKINGFLGSFSSSDSGNAGQGGAICLTAANDIKINGGLDSNSSSFDGNAAQGGAIRLTAGNNIDININSDFRSSSYSQSGNAAQGGAIRLTAANDININGDLRSSSFSFDGNGGQGGAIRLTAANDININGSLSSYSSSYGNGGQGGAIRLTAANDINIRGCFKSRSESKIMQVA